MVNDLKDMTELKTLNLYQNSISVFEPGAFDDLVQLEILSLWSNLLTSIPNISPLKALKEFLIGENPLNNFDLSGLGDLANLTIFDAHQTKIKSTLTLPKLRTLNEIDVARNELTRLVQGIFEGFESLEYVRLSHNKLSTLPYLGSGAETIHRLYLNDNRFYLLPDLKNFKSLWLIDLSENYISIISRDFFEFTTANIYHTHIDLFANPVLCMTQMCGINVLQWYVFMRFTCVDGVVKKSFDPELLCEGKWYFSLSWLTYFGLVTKYGVENLPSSNRLIPVRRQASNSTNADLLSIERQK